MTAETVVIHEPRADLIEGAATMLAVAKAYRIDCPEMREAAGEDLQRVKRLARDLEAERKSLTKPLDDVKTRIMDLFRKPAQFLADAETALKRACLAYDGEQERKRLAAAAEAARLAEQERKRLAEVAAKELAAGNVETAQTIAATAELVAPLPVAEHAPIKVAGEQHREVWRAEVEDMVALAKAVVDGKAPPECLLPNMPVLHNQARAFKRALAIPGVRAVCERILAARAA